MRTTLLASLYSIPFLLTGCGTLRNIEQWKCDNLGMCHFGITPSLPYPKPWESDVYSPVPVYGEAGEAMIGSPLAPESSDYLPPFEEGEQPCEHCRK